MGIIDYKNILLDPKKKKPQNLLDYGMRPIAQVPVPFSTYVSTTPQTTTANAKNVPITVVPLAAPPFATTPATVAPMQLHPVIPALKPDAALKELLKDPDPFSINKKPLGASDYMRLYGLSEEKPLDSRPWKKSLEEKIDGVFKRTPSSGYSLDVQKPKNKPSNLPLYIGTREIPTLLPYKPSDKSQIVLCSQKAPTSGKASQFQNVSSNTTTRKCSLRLNSREELNKLQSTTYHTLQMDNDGYVYIAEYNPLAGTDGYTDKNAGTEAILSAINGKDSYGYNAKTGAFYNRDNASVAPTQSKPQSKKADSTGKTAQVDASNSRQTKDPSIPYDPVENARTSFTSSAVSQNKKSGLRLNSREELNKLQSTTYHTLQMDKDGYVYVAEYNPLAGTDGYTDKNGSNDAILSAINGKDSYGYNAKTGAFFIRDYAPVASKTKPQGEKNIANASGTIDNWQYTDPTSPYYPVKKPKESSEKSIFQLQYEQQHNPLAKNNHLFYNEENTKDKKNLPYPNTAIRAKTPEDGGFSLKNWKKYGETAGDAVRSAIFGMTQGLIANPNNYLSKEDERVNVILDGDRVYVERTDQSDGKIMEKVSTKDGFTYVPSKITEEKLAKELGFDSVKSMKLALISERDHMEFMNQGKGTSTNVRYQLASDYKGISNTAAKAGGFVASFLPFYGDTTDAAELITGEDIRTGEKLPFWQRGITAAATVVPVISGSGVRSAIMGIGNTLEAVERIVKGGDEVLEGAGKVVKNLKPQNLMDELAQSGVKYSVDDVAMVVKTPDGKLMWLEKGNASSGLQHITYGHAADFVNRGINDIPEFLVKVLQETPVKTGVNKAGPFAEYLFGGKIYKVAYGTNGYIVSFFPLK